MGPVTTATPEASATLANTPDHIAEAMRRYVRGLDTYAVGDVKRTGNTAALREAARDELLRRS